MQDFIAIGDTGQDSDDQKKVAKGLETFCAQKNNICDAALLLGDNVYEIGMKTKDDPLMDRVFKNYYSNLKFKFYAVLGNHDYNEDGNNLKIAEYQVDYGKKNLQFVMPKRYYIKEFKHSVVVFLDTMRIIWNFEISEQKKLLQEAYLLSKNKNKWLIVTGHHPYLSNGGHGNAGKYEGFTKPYYYSGIHFKTFFEENICGKANLYLSGHAHILNFIDGNIKKCNTYLIISGSGSDQGTIYKNNPSDFGDGANGFVHLKIKEREITARVIRHDLKELFLKKLFR
jgi:predicted phosphodiesterase